MKNDDQKFLATFRTSPLGAKIVLDVETDRLARRRGALEKLTALRKTEADFWEKLRAGQAALADRGAAYEAAAKSPREAGTALYVAERHVETIVGDRERIEGAARGEVVRQGNPRINELFWEPMRLAIDQARAAPASTETTGGGFEGYFRTPVPKKFRSSRPSILARIAFIEHAQSLAYAFLLNMDDRDETLTIIREAILAAAPSVDALVIIADSMDGGRDAKEREIASAIAKANELAKKRFGVMLKDDAK